MQEPAEGCTCFLELEIFKNWNFTKLWFLDRMIWVYEGMKNDL